VKSKQWALAGGEVAMQSVTVVKEKRNDFDETTAARSELLPRHALTLAFGLGECFQLGPATGQCTRDSSSTQYVKILIGSKVDVSRGYRSAAG
jgi:hypothetical protein